MRGGVLSCHHVDQVVAERYALPFQKCESWPSCSTRFSRPEQTKNSVTMCTHGRSEQTSLSPQNGPEPPVLFNDSAARAAASAACSGASLAGKRGPIVCFTDLLTSRPKINSAETEAVKQPLQKTFAACASPLPAILLSQGHSLSSFSSTALSSSPLKEVLLRLLGEEDDQELSALDASGQLLYMESVFFE